MYKYHVINNSHVLIFYVTTGTCLCCDVIDHRNETATWCLNTSSPGKYYPQGDIFKGEFPVYTALVAFAKDVIMFFFQNLKLLVHSRSALSSTSISTDLRFVSSDTEHSKCSQIIWLRLFIVQHSYRETGLRRTRLVLVKKTITMTMINSCTRFFSCFIKIYIIHVVLTNFMKI